LLSFADFAPRPGAKANQAEQRVEALGRVQLGEGRSKSGVIFGQVVIFHAKKLFVPKRRAGRSAPPKRQQ
jgi:hypothetical protein